MAVRSKRFFGGTGHVTAATWQRLYLVPAGRTARFSVINVANFNGGGNLCYLGVGTAAAVGAAIWSETLAGGLTRILGEEYVLEPADALWGYATLLQVTWSGFGSLLLGAPE